MRIDVLGVGFDNVTMEEAIDRGMELLHSQGCHYVVTPNPEIVEVCRENPAACGLSTVRIWCCRMVWESSKAPVCWARR